MKLPYPAPSSPAAAAVMRGNRRRDTRPELLLRSALHKRGLRFRKDLAIRIGQLTVRPDVVFTRQRVAVFLDGCFWHACPQHGNAPSANTDYWTAKLERNRTRDSLVNRGLEADGWVVVRIWEHETVNLALQRVAQALEERAGIRAASSSGA